MSRAADGTYTLPVGSMNPAVTGTAISSTDFNALADDIEAALTDSLSRSGKGGMTAAMTFDAGSNAAPGITFTGDLDTGIYHPAANEVAVTVGGTQVAKFTGTALTVTGNLVLSGTGITRPNLPTVGQATSTAIDLSPGSSTVEADLTGEANLATATGRPIVVVLQPTDGAVGNQSYFIADAGGTRSVSIFLKRKIGAAAYADVGHWVIQAFASASAPVALPVFLDAPGAGSITYKFTYKISAGIGVSPAGLWSTGSVIKAYEL
jgi:hypothetical protein